MNWGVTAIPYSGERSDEAMIQFGIQHGCEHGYIQKGDVVVATAGSVGEAGSTDMIRVVTVGS